mmetsp:Transcript_30106/g.64073  ORF Transcript_30106/g.64073 Transcript_30106/m.64073 type:complete len:229 (+) Transcript_30106:529-1215(+)
MLLPDIHREVAMHMASEKCNDPARRRRVRLHQVDEGPRGWQVALLRPTGAALRLVEVIHRRTPLGVAATELRRQGHAPERKWHVKQNEHRSGTSPTCAKKVLCEGKLLLVDLVVRVVEEEHIDILHLNVAEEAAIAPHQALLKERPECSAELRLPLRVVAQLPRATLLVPIVVASRVNERDAATRPPQLLQHPVHGRLGREVHNVSTKSDDVNLLGASHPQEPDKLIA